MRILSRLLAGLVALLALLPIVNWIPGGYEMAAYSFIVSDWLTGAAIVVGGGLVATILSSRMPAMWREGLWRRCASTLAARPLAASLGIAASALCVYITVAFVVFDARPLLMDELVSVLHARIFAGGRLSLPASPYPEFFSALHLVDSEGKVYSHYPAGGPAMIALGELAGVPWLIGPICAAIAVALWISYLRVAEERPGVVYGAALLLALSPFVMFMSGTFMNHVPVMMWLLLAMAALAHVVTSAVPRPWLALALGIGYGCAATIRPLDAAAFALPAGAWLLWRAVRDRSRLVEVVAAGAGVALPIVALLWVNSRTTGDPFRFGYNVLWGGNVGLGFHEAPWGDPHTPARGLELVNLYLLRLQMYLFELPVPSLLPALGAFFLTRSLGRFDRYLITSSALLLGVYFLYWHEGYYLGPRFVFPLVPLFALWTARFLPLLRERFGTARVYRTAVYGSIIAAVLAICVQVPIRGRQYASLTTTIRWDADSAAELAGARNALVFVRESWGAQIIPRMWVLGISRTDADRLYRHVDTCILDQGVSIVEERGLRGSDAVAALRPLLRDSSRVVKSTFSPDYTERYLPGTKYPPRCRQRLAEDAAGFTHFTPLLLARGGGNIYARDLHERNAVLLAAHPDRPVWLIKPPTSRETEMPQFVPLSRDSLLQAWGVTHP